MFLDDLLERNRAWTARRTAKPLPPVEAVRLAVVTCFDPRLDPLLRPALGLEEGQGFLLRTAGASVTPTSTSLRSLALAVFLFEVRQVLVLGHSSCRMAAFDVPGFVDAFRSRDVPREAFGDEDLRTWAGALASPRQGVLDSVAAIASAPFLPRDLEIAGAVLDDTSGKIDVVARPGEAIPGEPRPAAGARESADGARDDPAPDEGAAAGAPAPPPDPVAPEAETPMSDELRTVRSAVDDLAAQAQMVAPLAQLRHNLQSETNPLRQLALLQQFIQSGAADTPELREAFKKIRQGVQAQAPRFLSQVILPLIQRKKP